MTPTVWLNIYSVSHFSPLATMFQVGGGRVCLRSVASSVHACLLKLRQFRNMSPTELSPLSAEILGPAWEDGSVPVMWNAKRVQSVHSQESEESTASPEPEVSFFLVARTSLPIQACAWSCAITLELTLSLTLNLIYTTLLTHQELKTNYYEWLKTIPLAATAAGITL
jgi:hypothetical protein